MQTQVRKTVSFFQRITVFLERVLSLYVHKFSGTSIADIPEFHLGLSELHLYLLHLHFQWICGGVEQHFDFSISTYYSYQKSKTYFAYNHRVGRLYM